jgi:hypothetical protein
VFDVPLSNLDPNGSDTLVGFRLPPLPSPPLEVQVTREDGETYAVPIVD